MLDVSARSIESWVGRSHLAIVMVLGVLVFDCSGKNDDSTNESGGATSSGGAGGHGGASEGGTGGSATSSTSHVPCNGEDPPTCVSGCGVDVPVESKAHCVDDQWVCDDSTVFLDTCAEGSCATAQGFCCNVVSGEYYVRSCLDDGYRQTCAMGSRTEIARQCIPDVLELTDCSSLDGTSCEAPLTSCLDAAGYHCTCELNHANATKGTWTCS
ncbi:MAG: hypothetical protein QM784_13345 [Polyangiaceae bacterium]